MADGAASPLVMAAAIGHGLRFLTFAGPLFMVSIPLILVGHIRRVQSYPQGVAVDVSPGPSE